MLQIRQPQTAILYAIFALIASLLGGCWGSDSGSATSGSTSSAALALTGTPANSAAVGAPYAFQPTVSQTTGQVIFSITGQPAWASFNSATGELSGTPPQNEAGSTANVTISASDGTSTASIGPFSIAVIAAGMAPGSVTLSWEPPTENTNGTAATELIGYYIYYGTNPDSLTNWVVAWGATTSSYVIENLAPGTYYFSVSACNWLGVESDPSGVVSTTI
jgi:hypothetical protein